MSRGGGRGSGGIWGSSLFLETFCEGKKCGCRRVMLMVHRRDVGAKGRGEHVTTIGYGWEPLSFYLSWMYGDREGAEFMRGPVLEPNRPFSVHDVEVLRAFEKVVRPDRCFSPNSCGHRLRRRFCPHHLGGCWCNPHHFIGAMWGARLKYRSSSAVQPRHHAASNAKTYLWSGTPAMARKKTPRHS